MIEARYIYTDAKGQARFKKLRFTGKRFKLRSADWLDRKGIWHYRDGITDRHGLFWTRALYRLPEVIAALKLNEPVWWCEGEKDAEAVARMGICATTTANPSDLYDDQARWFARYGSTSHVYVVCDQDEHGGWWGWERYTALLRVGVDPSRITILTPAWRLYKDVSDVIEATGSASAMRVVDLGAIEDCATRYGAARAAAYAASATPPSDEVVAS